MAQERALFTIARNVNRMPFLFEALPEESSRLGIVFDNQDPHWVRHTLFIAPRQIEGLHQVRQLG